MFEGYDKLTTPCFIVEERLLRQNLECLNYVMEQTGCHILLAQKCFSMYHTYPLIGKYLSGTTASGLHEALLGKEYMGKENHVFSAAYREEEMPQLLELCDHIVFNSFSQWEHFNSLPWFQAKAKETGTQFGIRINPQCSTQEGHAIYDPCAPGSRMGVTKENFREELLDGISGLHFHTLCEQNSDALELTVASVEEQFGAALHKMKWLNLGGGHHITKSDYDVDRLIRVIRNLQEKYDLEIYLEPGEAVALNAGFLEAQVLDVVHNGIEIAILDTSAACHMPDVLEMPYTPRIVGARIKSADDELEDKVVAPPDSTKGDWFHYRLAGPTCLAGDVIGDYYFDHPLSIGEKLIFEDMAIYSMVKTNTFNGMNLPDIVYHSDDKFEVVKTFGYEDFKKRI